MIALQHRPETLPGQPAEATQLGPSALQTELDILGQFHLLLRTETAALESTGSADLGARLAALASERARLATLLQAATRARTQAFQRQGIAAHAGAIGAFIDSVACSPGLRLAWQTLQRGYRQIAARQRANAVFIQRQMEYLSTRWNGLAQSAGNGSVYTRTGASQGAAGVGRPSRQLLASA